MISVSLIGLAGCSSSHTAPDIARSRPAPLASALRPEPPPVPPAPVSVAMAAPAKPQTAIQVAPMTKPAAKPDSEPVSLPALDATQVPKVRGVYKVGSPYVINGQTYTPAEDPGYDRTGHGSWYGHDFHGKQTANGEIFDMNALTAAHPTLPLPSYVYVTNMRNGRTLLVRVNDRGPYKPGRIIDLSRGVARALAFEGQGVTDVRVRYAGRAPLEPNDRTEWQFLASQAWGRGVRPPFSLGMSVVANSR